MNIKRWALPLFKSVGLVPKSSKTIARSQIKCASCIICSYHLLETPDLSPPFKDMYICDVCNRTYHWQCLLKTSCCNATEREAIDTIISWTCPACINLNQNEKESCIYFQKREIVEVSCNPTWEPEELQSTCESFKQSLKNYEEQITAPNLSQPALDEHLNDLQKQGFSAIQEDNKYQPYNVDFRNKVSFDSNPPTHRLTLRPQGIVSTGSQPLISWLSRKEYPILPRWPYASWCVHRHSSLYLQSLAESVKVCLLPSAFTYCKRPLIRQSAAAYTATLNLHPSALHQNL